MLERISSGIEITEFRNTSDRHILGDVCQFIYCGIISGESTMAVANDMNTHQMYREGKL